MLIDDYNLQVNSTGLGSKGGFNKITFKDRVSKAKKSSVPRDPQQLMKRKL